MPAPASRTLAFGRFGLDLDRHRLTHDGRGVRLPSRALFVLAVLAENPRRLITKEELSARAWPDGLATDANLMVQISKLRRVLRADGDEDGWIRTVRGRGYHFDVEVQVRGRDGRPLKASAATTADPFRETLQLGMLAHHEFDPVDAQRAADHFDRCLQLRPEDGTALAYRALTWIHQWYLGLCSGQEVLQCAPGLAQRALECCPDLPLAHVAHGALAYAFERDFTTSDASFQYALELDGGCAAAHEYLAYSLLARARFEEGHRHLRLAQWRSPSHLGLAAHVGTAFYLERLYDRAIESYDRVLAVHPEQLIALAFRAICACLAGRHEDARRFHATLEREAGDVPMMRSICGYVCALTGESNRARAALDWLQARRREGATIPPLLVAAVQVPLGEHDEAMAELHSTLEDPFPAQCMLAVEPTWDPLREREDFRRLLVDLNLDGIA